MFRKFIEAKSGRVETTPNRKLEKQDKERMTLTVTDIDPGSGSNHNCGCPSTLSSNRPGPDSYSQRYLQNEIGSKGLEFEKKKIQI